MFAYGVLAIFQVCFIPGAIIHRLVRPQASVLEFLPLSFALSLIVNYLVVILLFLSGLYTRSAVLVLIAMELVAGLFFLWKYPKASRSTTDGIKLGAFVGAISRWRDTWPDVLCVFSILAAVAFNFRMLGEVFIYWDAVLSYNRWAVEWFHGGFPTRNWTFPQLLSTNWSLVYKIIGTSEVQPFTKAVSFLFLPLSMLLFADLWRSTGKTRFALAMPIWLISVPVLVRSTIWGGYADTPVAFMGLCALYCYWRFCSDNKVTSNTWFLLGMACVAGAAETKQAGFFLAVLLPVAFYIKNKSRPVADRLPNRLWLYAVVIYAVIFVWWYLFTWYRISFQGASSALPHLLNDIHEGRNYLERIYRAWDLWKTPFVLVILSIPSLRHRDLAPLCVAAWVFVLIWATMLSYDSRNSMLAIPLLTICVAQTLLDLASKLRLPFRSEIERRPTAGPGRPKPQFLSPAIIAAFLVVGVAVVGAATISNKEIRAYQFERQMGIGRADVNQLIKKTIVTHGAGSFLTSYLLVQYLPEPYNSPVVRHDFLPSDFDGAKLTSLMDREKPKYILVPSYANSAMLVTVATLASNNRIVVNAGVKTHQRPE